MQFFDDLKVNAELTFGSGGNVNSGDRTRIHSRHADLTSVLDASDFLELGINMKGLREELIAIANQEQADSE